MIEIEPFVEQTAAGLIENEKRGKGDARPIAAGRNAQIVARMHGGDNTFADRAPRHIVFPSDIDVQI